MPRRPHRNVVIAVVAGVLVAGVGGVALASRDEGVRLRALTDPWGETMVSPESAYVSFDAFPVCLTAPGEARITGVEPVRARGGITITDFSTVTFDQVGSNPSTTTARIRDVPYLQGPRTVTAECLPGQPNDTELAVEIHVTDPSGGAIVDGLTIRYLVGSKERTTDVPVSLGACRTRATCPEPDLSE